VSRIFRIFCSLLLIASAVPVAAAASSVEAQRAWFYEAREALDTGDMGRYRELRPHLKNYPLLPYLELWEAAKKLEQGDDLAVGRALERHASIPEATSLKIRWIKNLAERGQWHQIAAAIRKNPPVADRLPEIAMLTLWYTGKKEEALKQFSDRWIRGYVATDSTSRLHRQWQQAGHPTRDELWARLERFAQRGNWKEVRSLEKLLPKSERKWVARWDAMQHEPLATLQQWQPDDHAHPVAAKIVADGLKRLRRTDVAAAWRELHRLKEVFDPYHFSLLERGTALSGAGQHLPVAATWLAGLPQSIRNERTISWQVRLHLLEGEWFEALKAIKELPEAEQEESRWGYWRARALEALGLEEDAAALYAETAKGRGYYSFLSAERLGVPYRFAASSLRASKRELTKLKKTDAMQRAREWWYLGESELAMREWRLALKDASKERWKAAAELASDWQWHDRVIQAAYMSGEIDALERRFPIAFERAVATMSKESGLPSSLIWSIIRQESAFNSQAVSSAGARGLMQLMPATAREVAGQNNVSGDLFDPDTNIRLGSLYLGKLVERFDQNHAIAAAAYNAGPHRVARWLERQPFEQADIWIESIPFEETRRYVQQVMAFTVVYDWRQSRKPVGIVAQIVMANEEG